jgi:prephenate dehydrogenase
VAYSLSIPVRVDLRLRRCHAAPRSAWNDLQEAHEAIAKGLLSEDDYLLQEILFNPRTPTQVEKIRTELKILLDIITRKDADAMNNYLKKIRANISAQMKVNEQ